MTHDMAQLLRRDFRDRSLHLCQASISSLTRVEKASGNKSLRRSVTRSLWNLLPSILVIHDDDNREQRKDQHVIFPLRQNKSVRKERDETTS